MDNKFFVALAIVAAIAAIAIVVAGGPLFLAIAVAVLGGLAGVLAPKLGRRPRNESVGIR